MKFDISVCVITYNHENFIESAIKSILAQQFTGNIEVIIGVDVSDDDTLAKAKNALQGSKWDFKIIEYKKRQGMFNNLYNVYRAASGEFIAMLEGDDYWIDNKKLMKQYSFMCANKNCVLTGGGINELKGGTVTKSKKWPTLLSRYYYFSDFVYANRLSFCTVMFRRNCLNLELLKEVEGSPHLDWPIYMILLKNKDAYFAKRFIDTFSMYRIHSGGVYSGVNINKRIKNIINTTNYNSIITNDNKFLGYYSAYKTFFGKKKIPSIKDLIDTYNLNNEGIFSFYRQVYGTKKLVKIILTNIFFLPEFVQSFYTISIRRFFNY